MYPGCPHIFTGLEYSGASVRGHTYFPVVQCIGLEYSVLHGVRKVTHGVRKVTHGVRKVTHGVRTVTHGVRKVTHVVGKVTHGVRKVTHGVTKVTHGVSKVTHGGRPWGCSRSPCLFPSQGSLDCRSPYCKLGAQVRNCDPISHWCS